MLASCKEQIQRITRHGIGSPQYSVEELRTLAAELHGAAFTVSDEADRRDGLSNLAMSAETRPSGLLAQLHRQYAMQTGEPVA